MAGHSPADEIAFEVTDLDSLIGDRWTDPDRWEIAPPVSAVAEPAMAAESLGPMQASV